MAALDYIPRPGLTLMMAHAVPFAAAAADVSNEPTFSGLAGTIANYVDALRINRNAALVLSRRVIELVDVAQAAGDAAQDLLLLLDNIREQLFAMKQQSPIMQFLNQKRNADNIRALTDRVQAALDVALLALPLHAPSNADALAQRSRGATMFAELATMTPSAASRAAHSGSVLPVRPSLYFGRSAETESAVDTVAAGGHLAILGGPGLGKTSLVLAVLHHPRVMARFAPRRYFVGCDGAEGQPCLRVVAGALGISRDVRRAMKDLLSDALIVLNNFESAWEDPAMREGAEATLAFLSEGCGATVVVTMRGSERPQSVAWARPFLPPLAPLEDDAAYQLFVSIADTAGNSDVADESLQGLLTCLGNVPLAVVLLATLAQYESLGTLQKQWDELRTSMLRRGAGKDRHSSLDVSIALSLSSARMVQVPDAVHLLSLLALLPSGAADADIRLWAAALSPRALPTLVRCSLAIRRTDGRVQVLAPIREYMFRYHAPSEETARPLLEHCFGLADLLRMKGHGPCPADEVMLVTPEVDNIHSAVRYALAHCADPQPALCAAVRMVSLYCHTGLGSPALLPIALDVARRKALDFHTAELLYHWGLLAWNTSYPGEPQTLLADALALYEKIEYVDGAIDATIHMATFLAPRAAIAQLDEMYARLLRRGDIVRAARCCQELAVTYERVGDVTRVRELHEQAIDHLLSIRDGKRRDRAHGISLCSLGECDLDAGNIARGMARLQEALVMFRASNHNTGIGDVEFMLGDAHLERGDSEIALGHLERALRAYQETGAANDVRCLFCMTRAYLALGDEEGAMRSIEVAENLVARSSDDSLFGRCWPLRARAVLALWQGDLAAARAILTAARLLARGQDSRIQPEVMLFGEMQVLELLAQVEHAEGNLDDAATLLITTLVGYTKLGSCVLRTCTLSALAEVVDDAIARPLLDAVTLPLQRFGYRPRLATALLHSAAVSHRQKALRKAENEVKTALNLFEAVRDERGSQRALRFIDACHISSNA